MEDAHVLTRHRDIQAWVSDRKGAPAMIRASNGFGEFRTRLALRFDAAPKPTGMAAVDQTASPVSWTAWLAELDRRQLALRVSDGEETAYELIERRALH